MFRRSLSFIALVFCASTYLLAATERATFVLTDGERKSGTVVFHGDQHENLINGYLNLGVENGKDMTFPLDQVAVIDFAGGQPPAAELANLAARHTLITRSGSAQSGRFVNMITGDTLLWENEAGDRQQYAIRDVIRVYLNAQRARTAFNYTAPAATPATATTVPGTRPARGTTVRVDAQQTWTDTGITVNQGDLVTFQASGEVRIGRSEGATATPDGSTFDSRNTNPNGARNRLGAAPYPAPGVAAGALIGRIGNGTAFGIGMQSQPLTMPASGRLALGVNDDDPSDNSGAFTVVVSSRNGRR